MKRCLLVVADGSMPVALVRRAVGAVRERFDEHDVVVLTHSGSLDAGPDDLPGVEILPAGTAVESVAASAAVFAWPPEGSVPGGLRRAAPKTQFLLRTAAGVAPRLVRLDGLDYEHRDTHVWNRLTSDFDKGYVYNPFGYYYRMAGMGPLDPFGFRIREDAEALANRPTGHKVIAFFGGSATWSIQCLHEEMFTARLEEMLNRHPAVIDAGLTFSCLNFGIVSSTVVNAMMAYLLYASRFRPDLVVAHDGYNDLLYGSYTDPYLLKEWKITYQCDLEPWGHLVHGQRDVEIIKTGQRPYQPRSVPDDIIAAYVGRKLQFGRVVEAAGTPFLWASQPLISHKQQHSQEEAEFLRVMRSDITDDWRDVRRGVHAMLAEASSLVRQESGHVVDFADVFRDAPSDATHFVDTCHLTPDGDALVATSYFDRILGLDVFTELRP